jgi:hypothetical protein
VGQFEFAAQHPEAGQQTIADGDEHPAPGVFWQQAAAPVQTCPDGQEPASSKQV